MLPLMDIAEMHAGETSSGERIAPAAGSSTAALHMPILFQPKTKAVPNRRLTLAILICSALVLLALIISGVLLQQQAMTTDFAAKNMPPSPSHLFGTDQMGRDMLVRTVAGLSTSILIGLFAAVLSAMIALALGFIAGLGGKRADAIICWLIDLMMGVPHIILLILISFALGKGFWGVTLGVALTHWASLTRVVRAEVMQCRGSLYVMAARKLGLTWPRVAITHILPFVLPQFLVGLVLLFPHAILHEAAITFLGFGLPPDMPAIGIILSESMTYLSAGMWWLAVFPGLALIAVVFIFDALGSSLRRLVDPVTAQE